LQLLDALATNEPHKLQPAHDGEITSRPVALRDKVGPHRRVRVVESRTGRPGRDLERLGDLIGGKPEVVVQDEDGALVRRQTPEAAQRPWQPAQ
jgi:hypothetical protein